MESGIGGTWNSGKRWVWVMGFGKEIGFGGYTIWRNGICENEAFGKLDFWEIWVFGKIRFGGF